ncbi:hypothetical protein C8F01DRAFT_1072293 [Mycena amicta]|nr:hypothetical protein C8F01DRAFT_1072293 [Mycena amicta]
MLALRPLRATQVSRILYRQLQTIPTPPDPHVPPSTSNPRRQQVQLHPAPIKPTKITTPPRPVVQTEPSVSLKALKETTTRDIADAEAHGILVPPPAGAGWAKSTLHKAVQLAKFYFRGVKLVYTRSIVARNIRARVDSGGDALERWEHRMLYTQAADMRRLAPFVLTALILEEVIPLIIIWAPGFLPSTCILPSQRERIQERATEKALAFITSHGPSLATLTRAASDGEIPLAALNRPEVICGLLGLSTFGLDFMRRRRIQRHLLFVSADDVFLDRDGIRSLSAQDLKQALRERGIVSPGLDTAQQTQKLSYWLKSVHDRSDLVARRIYLVALMGSR